ncbi:hypothetical protein [Streptomyces sp. NPDC049944]|uniref:hypothetical protein n=1 Tax=Streptomyces sp. NPDC049944 TaxID=3155657 RepID=UPI00341719CF
MNEAKYCNPRIPTLHQCRRDSTEALIGGVTGSLHRPQVLLLGRNDTTGRLRLVGKTTPLKPGPAQEVVGHLTAAGPDHPWTGVRFTASWNSRTPLEPVLVDPVLVAEISADVSQDHGVWRHPLRYERLPLDAARADVLPFGATQYGPRHRSLSFPLLIGVGLGVVTWQPQGR